MLFATTERKSLTTTDLSGAIWQGFVAVQTDAIQTGTCRSSWRVLSCRVLCNGVGKPTGISLHSRVYFAHGSGSCGLHPSRGKPVVLEKSKMADCVRLLKRTLCAIEMLKR